MKVNISINFTWVLVISIILGILKCFGIINISWVWVLSPIWILAIIALIILAVFKIKGWL